MKWKICNYCNYPQPLSWFAKNGESTDGHLGVCLTCDRKRKKVWYILNRKREQIKRKRWQDKNSRLHLFHVRKYMKTEKGRAARQRYYEKLKKVANG